LQIHNPSTNKKNIPPIMAPQNLNPATATRADFNNQYINELPPMIP